MSKKPLPTPTNMSREDVEEMQRFRNIIENGFSSDPWSRVGGEPPREDSKAVRITEGAVQTPNGADKDMIKFVSLMEGMYGNEKLAAEKLVEASAKDPEIAEALETTVTDGGIKIGKWQIRVRTDESSSKKKKYYDVAHSISKQVIAKNLYIYEAALALVRLLNKGKPINGSEINEVLRLEKEYYANRVDALTHQVNSLKAVKNNDQERAFILETRQKEAVNKARILEEQLRRIAKSSL